MTQMVSDGDCSRIAVRKEKKVWGQVLEGSWDATSQKFGGAHSTDGCLF